MADTKTETKVARPVREVVDWDVMVDGFSAPLWMNVERQARDAEALAAEINALLSDHHSMRGIKVRVVRKTAEVCSCCKSEWEPYEEGGVTNCANCGATVETTR